MMPGECLVFKATLFFGCYSYRGEKVCSTNADPSFLKKNQPSQVELPKTPEEMDVSKLDLH